MATDIVSFNGRGMFPIHHFGRLSISPFSFPLLFFLSLFLSFFFKKKSDLRPLVCTSRVLYVQYISTVYIYIYIYTLFVRVGARPSCCVYSLFSRKIFWVTWLTWNEERKKKTQETSRETRTGLFRFIYHNSSSSSSFRWGVWEYGRRDWSGMFLSQSQ